MPGSGSRPSCEVTIRGKEWRSTTLKTPPFSANPRRLYRALEGVCPNNTNTARTSLSGGLTFEPPSSLLIVECWRTGYTFSVGRTMYCDWSSAVAQTPSLEIEVLTNLLVRSPALSDEDETNHRPTTR